MWAGGICIPADEAFIDDWVTFKIIFWQTPDNIIISTLMNLHTVWCWGYDSLEINLYATLQNENLTKIGINVIVHKE